MTRDYLGVLGRRLSRTERAVLAEVVTSPGVGIAEIASEVGLSDRRIRDVVNALAARGLIRAREARTARTWRRVFDPSARGVDVLTTSLRRAG